MRPECARADASLGRYVPRGHSGRVQVMCGAILALVCAPLPLPVRNERQRCASLVRLQDEVRQHPGEHRGDGAVFVDVDAQETLRGRAPVLPVRLVLDAVRLQESTQNVDRRPVGLRLADHEDRQQYASAPHPVNASFAVEEARNIAPVHGAEYSGKLKDMPHFELPGWRSFPLEVA